ncbi:MAG: 4a-hydroxytetrahydrobiopterin dehydratase [Ignavibacteria bacterium]|nr:4a-hydroxytetrahydrobiopterin dehydratase [Ignavibacteria bacterium]
MNKEKIEEELRKLRGWKRKGDSIVKVFKTRGYSHTLALSVAIGSLCQQYDHHPDYMTLKYSEIEVSFSTHSEGGITEKDINIAKEIETLNIA